MNEGAESLLPEILADYPCVCGENPLWHPVERKLYWVDIPTGALTARSRNRRHEKACKGGPSAA